jgi:hypothetical protein
MTLSKSLQTLKQMNKGNQTSCIQQTLKLIHKPSLPPPPSADRHTFANTSWFLHSRSITLTSH